VDAAQTAGLLPIDMQAMHIDLLGFTGHKGLQGPPGTGGLLIGEGIDTAEIPPLVRGGTGSSSELEYQPNMLPDCYESGTPNGVGFAGLGAGLAFVRQRGLDTIRAHELALTERLIAGLVAIPGVTVYGPQDIRQRTATVSFTVAGRHVSQVGWALDEDYGILCRVGLHCAPAAHRTIGTFPEGTVRMAAGVFTTLDEIDRAIEAVAEVARS
jgi:cysteine desulfurase / selenocysteine lyase